MTRLIAEYLDGQSSSTLCLRPGLQHVRPIIGL